MTRWNTTRPGATLVGVVHTSYLFNQATMQITQPGESVLFIADFDNNRWLVEYYAADAIGADQPPINVRGTGVLSVDCDLLPNGVERIPHTFNTRDVEVEVYRRQGTEQGRTVTIPVQREQTAVTVASAPGGQYRVVIVGKTDTGEDTIQRVRIANCDTTPNVPERIVHNWNTRDVDVSIFDRTTGNPATPHINREQNAVVITSSVALSYRVEIEELKQ